MPSKKSN